LSNKCALHRHCHDQRHANSPGRFGVNDHDQKTEEPCEATSFTHGSEAERRGRPLRLG
jgi:hypothetical protein